MTDHLKEAKEILEQQAVPGPTAKMHVLVDIAESLRKIAEHLFWLNESIPEKPTIDDISKKSREMANKYFESRGWDMRL